MERGLRIPQKERTKTTNAILVSLMNQLEKDKKSLKLGPEDNLYVEGFASNVFAKADKQDRAGRADLNTAKTFYAASIFFEILNQFGELQPEHQLEQKQKYAVWKAADIRKALKEGRKPEPGPPGGDKDLSIPSVTPSAAYDLGPREINPTSHPGPVDFASPQFHDKVDHQPSSNTTTPPPSYPTEDYSPNDFHPPPPVNRPENDAYPQPYLHQHYLHEPQQPLPQNYPSQETPSPSSYPNFQSYPSFNESSLPTAPSHYPSYYQGSDISYSHQSAPPTANYSSTAQYTSSGSNGFHAEPAPTSAQTFQYDSNYQPPPDKIAEAHKAARFAVGALAFDDVPVAVDFLRKSLELLTNPSTSQ
ncbi:hypothetical protein HHK36_003337 [Tetracentron sinense]|uniref:Uncharacterized protein n=1 Tax=Tetracentron sinense TaxID=13715 RepID=A0A834ZSQ8_TETSI|nr:hypothetical protein HHK36_003337 [Tetracentron sinense]